MIDMFLGMGQCVIMGWPRLMATFTLHFAMETYMIINVFNDIAREMHVFIEDNISQCTWY